LANFGLLRAVMHRDRGREGE